MTSLTTPLDSNPSTVRLVATPERKGSCPQFSQLHLNSQRERVKREKGDDVLAIAPRRPSERSSDEAELDVHADVSILLPEHFCPLLEEVSVPRRGVCPKSLRWWVGNVSAPKGREAVEEVEEEEAEQGEETDRRKRDGRRKRGRKRYEGK